MNIKRPTYIPLELDFDGTDRLFGTKFVLLLEKNVVNCKKI